MTNFKTERILTNIAATIFVVIGLAILFIGCITPIQFNINGTYFTATYLEVANISMGGFLLWTFFYGVPLIIGILGFVCSSLLKRSPKKFLGVIIIIMGVISVFSLIGILYLIAGIMVISNKYWKDEHMLNA